MYSLSDDFTACARLVSHMDAFENVIGLIGLTHSRFRAICRRSFSLFCQIVLLGTGVTLAYGSKAPLHVYYN